MKRLISIILTFIFLGCASHKRTNKLASEIDCKRNFYFAYDERSDFEKFKYEGLPTYGSSKFPDFKQTFIKSVNELNKETKMSLVFVDHNILSSNSDTFAKVRIEDIRLVAGFSSAVLEVNLLYQMEDEEIRLTGKNKMNLGFTKKGSLYKAIKNGHYLFISSICSRPARASL